MNLHTLGCTGFVPLLANYLSLSRVSAYRFGVSFPAIDCITTNTRELHLGDIISKNTELSREACTKFSANSVKYGIDNQFCLSSLQLRAKHACCLSNHGGESNSSPKISRNHRAHAVEIQFLVLPIYI